MISVFLCLLSVSIFYKNSAREFPRQKTPFANWILTVSEDRNGLSLTYLGRERDLAAEVAIDGVRTLSTAFEDRAVSLPIEGSPTQRTLNEIKVIISNGEDRVQSHILQLARETPEFLKREYGFSHETGYVVIERNTFLLRKVEDRHARTVPHRPVDSEAVRRNVQAMIIEHVPGALEALRADGEDNEAAVYKSAIITRFLWGLYSSTGPSNSIRPDMNTYQILRAIRESGETVQCAGTRDLFIDVARLSGSGLEVRKVNAFRYYPYIENVVVNSHAILEIKTEQGWVLFDPFARVYFRQSKGGRLLSAEIIKGFLELGSLETIRPVHVETEHERRSDFDRDAAPFDPYNWNYFTHFHHLVYSE